MRLASLFMVSALCACGSPGRYVEDDGERAFAHREDFDEDRARERAAEDLEGESFDSVGDTSTCTEDCSGHEAGFDWARDQGITDASECGGNSQSFEEGCETYAEAIEARAEDARAEHEDGGDSYEDYWS